MIKFYRNSGTFYTNLGSFAILKNIKKQHFQKKNLKVWQPFMLCFCLQYYLCVLILMKVTTYFMIFLSHKNSFCTLQDTLFIKYFLAWFSLINLIHPESNSLIKIQTKTFLCHDWGKKCKQSKIKSGTKIEVLFGELSLA